MCRRPPQAKSIEELRRDAETIGAQEEELLKLLREVQRARDAADAQAVAEGRKLPEPLAVKGANQGQNRSQARAREP